MTVPKVSLLNFTAPSRQLGQSTVEYVVLTAAIATALGVGMVDDGSALRQLLDAFALAYKKISFAISLP